MKNRNISEFSPSIRQHLSLKQTKTNIVSNYLNPFQSKDYKENVLKINFDGEGNSGRVLNKPLRQEEQIKSKNAETRMTKDKLKLPIIQENLNERSLGNANQKKIRSRIEGIRSRKEKKTASEENPFLPKILNKPKESRSNIPLSLNDMLSPQNQKYANFTGKSNQLREKKRRNSRSTDSKLVESQAFQLDKERTGKPKKIKSNQNNVHNSKERNTIKDFKKLSNNKRQSFMNDEVNETINSLKYDSRMLPSILDESQREKEFQVKKEMIEIGNRYLKESKVIFKEKSKLNKAKKLVEVQTQSIPKLSKNIDNSANYIKELVEKPKSLNAMTKFFNVLNKSNLVKNMMSPEVMGQIQNALKSVDHHINLEKKPSSNQYLNSIRMKLALMEKM